MSASAVAPSSPPTAVGATGGSGTSTPAEKTPYIILGHGHEELIDFASRSTIPPGVTLVTLIEFGTPTIIRDVCPFLEAFADPSKKELFENPIENFSTLSAMIGRPLRIYTEGMKYPKLSGSLSFHFFMGSGTKMHYGLSGVNKFPIQLKILNPDGTQPCEKYMAVERLGIPHPVSRPYAFKSEERIDDFLTNAYEHSLMPTKQEVKSIFDANPRMYIKVEDDSLENQLMTPIEKIWERLGSGIYYFVICRAVKSTPLTRSFEEIVGSMMEMADVDPERYKPLLAHKQNWLPYLDQLYDLIKEDYDSMIGTYGESSFTRKMKTLLDQVDLLRSKAPLLRANSNAQQTAQPWRTARRRRGSRGGRRKTRKGKRLSRPPVR